MKEDRTVVAAGDARNDAEKLGITHGMVVQELGWDEDTDDDLRALIEQQCGSELVDEDTDEVIDVALLWWRDGDGDLVDALVDAIGPLADDGMVWVLSPKTGIAGHVEPSEIAEAAPTAGLTQTLTMNLGDWTANRLVQPKVRGKR
jgi:threonine dehydrogenase-like Zn-dependent dehydrogenase